MLLALALLAGGCGSSSVSKAVSPESAIATEGGLDYSQVIVNATMKLDLGVANAAVPSIDGWGKHGSAYWGDQNGSTQARMLFTSNVRRSDVVAALVAAQARAKARYDAAWHGGTQDWTTAPNSIYQGDNMTVLVEWTDGSGVTHHVNLDDLFEQLTSLTAPLTGTCGGGGSGTLLVDAAGDFVNRKVVVGMCARNTTDGSLAAITAVTATTLTTEALTGGTSNTFAAGNAYEVLAVRPFSPHWVFAAPAFYLQTEPAPGAAPGGYTGCFVCPWNCSGTIVPNNSPSPKGVSPSDVPLLRLKKDVLGWGTVQQAWRLMQGDPLKVILRVHHSDVNQINPTI
jgi:hypothetical protein